jgi:hypothetical protein
VISVFALKCLTYRCFYFIITNDHWFFENYEKFVSLIESADSNVFTLILYLHVCTAACICRYGIPRQRSDVSYVEYSAEVGLYILKLTDETAGIQSVYSYNLTDQIRAKEHTDEQREHGS